MGISRRDVLTQFALAASSAIAARLVSAGAMSSGGLHGPIKRSVLNASQRKMLATLADMIIPPTDTPGAVQAGVPEFIEHIVNDWYTTGERHIFLAGLVELDADCLRRFGRPFEAITVVQQVDALSAAEARSNAFRNAQANPSMGIQQESETSSPFFYKLKELTVLGYYTSELGATTELNYNPVPGHFDGDVDFKATGGRQWST